MSLSSEHPISNGGPHLSYKIILFLIFCALFIMAGVEIGVVVFLCKRGPSELIVPCGIVIFLLAAVMIVLLLWLYFPIVKIERALVIFETYGEDFSVSENCFSDTYPITHSLNHIHSRLRESIDREYVAYMKQKDAEIHALQSQINPHFLYNTLDSIRGLALINDDADVADMTEALSVFFRYSIGQKGNIVTLQDELDNIKTYLVIQNNRFKNKLFFQVLFDGSEADILRCRLPKLLLQPIIENAVYHGIEPKIGPGHIVIRISTTEKRLIINVQDDGIGMDEAALKSINQKLRQGKHVDESTHVYGNGIALININQRIILNYGEGYGVTLASTAGVGSEVELTLPIIYDI